MSTLKLTSDTLAVTPAGGEIEYNGQFFGADSNNSRAQFERLVLETSKTASGTSIDFTGIPAWVKRITVMFQGISTSGTSAIQIQIGAGSYTTSGYLGGSDFWSTTPSTALFTTGFAIVDGPVAGTVLHGMATICSLGSNNWVCSSQGMASNSAGYAVGAGSLALGGTLDRVRVTTVNGTDTFDAGSINILYEG